MILSKCPQLLWFRR